MTAQELFILVDQTRRERGWGRALRSSVSEWYCGRPAGEVAADMLRCPAYLGYTHRDLLRLAHPKPPTPAHNALFQWAAEGGLGHLATAGLLSGELRQVYGFELLKQAENVEDAAGIIDRYDLSADMIPAEWREFSEVWERLIERMPAADVVRHLTAMTDAGVLETEGPITALVVARVLDRKRLAAAGIGEDRLARVAEEYARHRNANQQVLRALASRSCAHS